MLGRTHAIAGLTAGLAASAATGSVEHTPIFAYAVAAFAALLPDLDQHKSVASRYRINKPAHVLLRHFRHRRFTHSFLGLTLFSLIVLILTSLLDGQLPGGLSPAFGEMALIGYASHIVADMFNKQGVHLFYPFVFRRVEWITMPLPRALRISTIYDPQGPPLTVGRLQASINTEKFFFRYPLYVLLAFILWHQIDGLVFALRHDVWSGVEQLPRPLADLAAYLLR